MLKANASGNFIAFLITAFLIFSSANILAQEENTNETQTETQTEQQTETQTEQQDQTNQNQKQDQMQRNDQQVNEVYKTSANEITENLAAQITLRDEQKDDIREAIYEYHEAVLELKHETESDIIKGQRENDIEEVNEATTEMTEDKSDMDQWLNEEIESILDESQKSQWQTVQATFWNQLRDKVATLKNESKTQDDMY